MSFTNDLKVSFFLSFTSIKRGSRKTTVLTIILMSIVVVNIAVIPSFISGVGKTFSQSSIDYTIGNLFISPNGDKIYIDDASSKLKKIEGVSGIVAASARYNTGATLVYKNANLGVNVLGINPDDEERVTNFHKKIIEGEFISENDENEIVLGYSISGEEGKGELADTLGGVKVGEKIRAVYTNGMEREYRVKGIYRATSFADYFAFISKKEAEYVLNVSNKASSIIIKTSEQGQEESYKRDIIGAGIGEKVKTWKEKMENVTKEVTQSLTILSIITVFVSLIIAAVVLFIVIYIHTVNKRKQMGILRAMGIKRGIIICSFVFESMFYTFAGIILGSFAITLFFVYLTNHPIDFITGDLIPVFEINILVQGFLSLILVSVIAGFIPSWRITSQNIVEEIFGK